MSIAKIGQIASKLIVSEAAMKLGKEVGAKLLKKGADETGKFAFNHTSKIINSKKEINQKYERIRQTFTAPEANLKTFKKAIDDSSNMVSYYQYDLINVNKKNPANIAKLKKLTAHHKKWEILLKNLREETSKRVIKEATLVYEFNRTSDFFNDFPDINNELISIESKEDFRNTLLKINKQY